MAILICLPRIGDRRDRGAGARCLVLSCVLMAAAACTGFRQHGDSTGDGGAGTGGTNRPGSARFGGNGGNGGRAGSNGGGGAAEAPAAGQAGSTPSVEGSGGARGGSGGQPGSTGGSDARGGNGGGPGGQPGSAGVAGAGARGGGGGQSGAAGGGRAGAGGIAGHAVGGSVDAGMSDAPPDSGAAGKPQGATCTANSDCALGHCVERVCCTTTCTGTCMSCLAANTGQTEGTCAAVKAGLAHGSDCTASDPTTCGLDGKCDGAGSCRRHVAGTTCSAESCLDGVSVSTYASARACDGHGTCSPAATTSMCGSTYRCSGTKCRTTCGTAQDCVTSAYCSNSTCLPKKADGQPCSAATECSTAVCGGRCCAAGCTCTLPSPGNLLKDPGVDVGVSDWMASVGTIGRAVTDAERCPYSGSMVATADTSQTVSQCVRNVPLFGNFNFGARFLGPGTPICQATFYSGFNCDGTDVLANETGPTTIVGLDGWQSISGSITGVSNANSVILTCYVGEATYQLDMFYLAKAPTTF